MIAVMGCADAQERPKGSLFGIAVMIAVVGYTGVQERSKGTL